MKKRNILIAVAILCLAAAITTAVVLISSERQIEQAKQEYEDIRDIGIIEPAPAEPIENAKYLNIDHLGLAEINPLYVGWIDIPGTVISYPLIWNANNDDYIKKTFEGKTNQAGVIFIDTRSSPSLQETNTVAHGHNIKDGSMFAELKKYMDTEFLKEHPEIQIYTPNGVHVYEVFLAEKTDTRSPAFTFSFDDNEHRDRWIKGLNATSGNRANLTADSKIISLSTCTKENEVGRYIVQAVLKEIVPNNVEENIN